ncbi:hypothetical protein GN958_ATG03795, partial [Phytophthora infestans]
AVPTGPTKRGRKKNVSTELWSTDAATALFTARYVTAKDNFKNATNNADIGNVPAVSDPPCLDLMMEHWAPHEGLKNSTLCDNITLEYGEDDEQVEEDTEDQGCRSSKRKNPTANILGPCALAEGAKTFGEAMKSTSSASNDGLHSRDIVAALHRQEAALHLQTSAINALLETLTRGTS